MTNNFYSIMLDFYAKRRVGDNKAYDFVLHVGLKGW